MPDNNYWAIGEKIGNTWNDGKKFKTDQWSFYTGKFKVRCKQWK